MRALLLLAAVVGVAAPVQSQSHSVALAPSAPMPRPDVVRGLYVNRWAVLDGRIWNLIEVAKATEVNALVIDVKDDRGYVLYRSAVPLARRIAADTTNPVPMAKVRAVLDTMRANGIYPIARIVVAKDPLLASALREWAVQRRSDSSAWLDGDGNPWLDPHQRGVWTYAADLATEAVRLGFSEVQFDYVRFPDDPRLLREARFPLAKGRGRDRVIHEQLAYLHQRMAALHVPMAIDVFGLTTSDTTDMGIGQRWEQFGEETDVVLPMTYPSHYSAGMYGLPSPNAAPYETIDRALRDAKVRNARLSRPPTIVPWYQDFTLGNPPYGVEQIRAQMQAGYDNGVRSWMLWNASSKYTVEALRPAILSSDEEMRAGRKP
ncbi:MAG: putative glycoside hydrolase [Gemmatimonadota bacterium]|nr:putative glycoside hydrolase [Gemmatimonadota bacterium]